MLAIDHGAGTPVYSGPFRISPSGHRKAQRSAAMSRENSSQILHALIYNMGFVLFSMMFIEIPALVPAVTRVCLNFRYPKIL